MSSLGEKGISPGVDGEGWDDTTPAYTAHDASDLLANPAAALNMDPMTPAEIKAGADYLRREGRIPAARIAELEADALARIS